MSASQQRHNLNQVMQLHGQEGNEIEDDLAREIMGVEQDSYDNEYEDEQPSDQMLDQEDEYSQSVLQDGEEEEGIEHHEDQEEIDDGDEE